MSDSNFNMINENKELLEILTVLPNYKPNSVLELGSRFNLDFSNRTDNLTNVNVETPYGTDNTTNNIYCINDNITKLKFGKNMYDIIYGSWLMMNLNENEMDRLFNEVIHALKKYGYFLFRELCFHATNNNDYISPRKYIDFLHSNVYEENHVKYGFELVFARPSRTYNKMKYNNEVYFLFKKVDLIKFDGHKTIKEYYDNMYSSDTIYFYERVFGYGFISPGGRQSSEEFIKLLDLKKGQKILDAGCGIGGGCFIMAEKYDVEVIGLDLISSMIDIAWERKQNYKNLDAHFEIGDITKHEFPQEYFDVIYSRETILHIKDKKLLFERFHVKKNYKSEISETSVFNFKQKYFYSKNWLKPGGKILITDYFRSNICPEEFIQCVENKGYKLITTAEYETILKDIGYENVVTEDISDKYRYYINCELEKIGKIEENCVKEFSLKYYDIAKSWRDNYEFSYKGYQKWVLFKAQKKAFI